MDSDVEEEGLDRSEHGSPADDYQHNHAPGVAPVSTYALHSQRNSPHKEMEMMATQLPSAQGLPNPAFPMNNFAPGMNGTMGMGSMFASGPGMPPHY